jgi:hypothetical protein
MRRDSPDDVLLVRRLLAAARDKSSAVASQLHPAWLQMAWQRIGIDPARGQTGPDCSDALAAVYRLRWSSLTSLRHHAHRIALLPRPELMRVLAAVALHADRERVRRCIGRTLRGALIERVGETAYAALLATPVSRASPAGRTGTLSLAELDADRLAAAGYTWLRAGGHWHSRTLLPWVKLALPPAHERAEAFPAHERALDDESPLGRLPDYLPEHAWLFGSPMDRALSASTTA